jgi:hypothetical protein
MVATALFLVTLSSLARADVQDLEQVSMLQTKRASTLATATTKRCEQFFRHSSAKGECPSGSRALLSAEECQIASQQVLLGDSEQKFDGNVESCQLPSGCFVGINPAGEGYGVFKWNSHSEGAATEFADVVCFGFEPEDSIEQNLPGETCTFHLVKSKPSAPERLATVEQILEKYCTAEAGCNDEGVINDLGIGMWVVAGLEDGQIDGRGHWNDAQSSNHAAFGHSDAVEPRHQNGFGDWIEARCSLSGGPPPPPEEMVVPPTEILIENVCISAMGDKPGALPVPVDSCVESIDIKHRSGRLSCRTAESGLSNFGCDEDSLGLVMADGKRVVAPIAGATKGLSSHYYEHAHWYRLPNVGRNSQVMSWKFTEPYLVNKGDYHLWYHEDLSGGTEGDNSGEACYDVTMHKKELSNMCSARAPVMYHKVCVGATDEARAALEASKKFPTIHLPEDTCVRKIDITKTSGWVSCHHDGADRISNFGCGTDYVGLVITKGVEKNNNNIVVPHESNTHGMTRTSHADAHWYKMSGVGQNTRTLTFDLKQQQKWSGDYTLWYAEQLSGWTEEDNAGQACYDVTIHRGTSC